MIEPCKFQRIIILGSISHPNVCPFFCYFLSPKIALVRRDPFLHNDARPDGGGPRCPIYTYQLLFHRPYCLYIQFHVRPRTIHRFHYDTKELAAVHRPFRQDLTKSVHFHLGN